MSHSPDPDPLPDDLDEARELLDRTMRFLAKCKEDPEAALRADDPQALIDGLQNLAAERRPEPVEPVHDESESRTIQLRPRRSA